MRITIIVDDNFVRVDNESTNSADLSWVPEGIHAVQWYDTYGEIEYKSSEQLNETIIDLGIFSQAVDSLNQAKELEQQKLEEIKNSIDYWKVLRGRRSFLLQATDWILLPDTTISNQEKTEWIAYRQLLRDLPDTTLDPKNPVWPTPPEGTFAETIQSFIEEFQKTDI